MKAINYSPQCNINQGNATLEQKKRIGKNFTLQKISKFFVK